MKKSLAILGLIAFSNAANSHFVDDELLKFDAKTEIAHFTHMPGKITPIIKANSDNELHNYIQMKSNQGNVQINEYKTHDDADSELHNYLDFQGGVQPNPFKQHFHDDADNELHNYYVPNNKGNVQVNDYKSHDDADNELHNYIQMKSNQGNVQINEYKTHDDADFSISQRPYKPAPKFIAKLISFDSREKKKDFLADN